MAAYGGEHQIVISREAAMDELMLRVEASAETAARGEQALAEFRADVARRVHKLLGLRAGVEVVGEGTLPRTDFKARRVVDDRAVFRDMYAELHRDGAS
jgi:phenylacetate-CoA ligase